MSGLAFPYAVSVSGRTATVDPDTDLANMVRQVVLTGLGHRVNRPTFGSRLDHLVFAGDSPELTSAVELLVRSALSEWLMDKLTVNDVQVAAGDAVLTVMISYAALPSLQPVVVTVTREMSL